MLKLVNIYILLSTIHVIILGEKVENFQDFYYNYISKNQDTFFTAQNNLHYSDKENGNLNDKITTKENTLIRVLQEGKSSDSNFENYSDYTTFAKACANINPASPKDCTRQIYPNYWCCYVKYTSSDNPSYCTAFYDLVARAKTLETSPDFSYTCSSEFINTLYIVFIFISLLLF